MTEHQEAYLARRKGIRGKQSLLHKGNPLGPDGKRLKCHVCNSEDHMARWCPDTKGKKGVKGRVKGLLPTLAHLYVETNEADNIDDTKPAEHPNLDPRDKGFWWLGFANATKIVTSSNFFVNKKDMNIGEKESSDDSKLGDAEYEACDLPPDSVEVEPVDDHLKRLGHEERR